MSARRPIDSQFDLFVPFVTDLPLRDQRETMERPFFSLAKRKRLKPIEYVSPDGTIFVNVFPNPEFGMATIWDADILIWAASVLNNLRKQGANELPRTLTVQPYDVLKAICRDTGGRQYQLLREGLGRLQSTSVVTNIRVQRGKKHRQFSWIESWADLVTDDGQSNGITITLSDWFYEGILMDGGLLSIDPQYFAITGGRERWLYRVARKHAGGAGADGFAIALNTLYEKSGAEGPYRRFKFEILAVVRRDDLPEYRLSLEYGKGEPSVRMCRRNAGDAAVPRNRAGHASARQVADTTVFNPSNLTDQTVWRVRQDFPGWDIYALKADFDAWLHEKPDRRPDDYQAAFYGFVRKQAARAAVDAERS
jgi:plasmid replication initiation protein